MENKNTTQLETTTLVLVPQNFLTEIREQQVKILEALSNKFQPKEKIGDYISEADAKKLLGKKTTWFWNMRKNSQLSSTKVGNQNYYSKADLLNLFEKNKKGGSND